MKDALGGKFCRIERLETVAVSLPIRPFQTTKRVRAGLGPLVSLDFVFVMIHAQDGLVGLGECVVMPVLFNLTVEGIRAVVERQIGPKLVGLSPLDMEQIGLIVDRTLPGGFIKAAIDMAIHDLVGKALDVPVHTLIGGKVRDRIPVCAEISTSNVAATPDQARALMALGFNSLKLKVGGNPATDAECFRAVRDAVGPDVELRVDANQGWTLKEALHFARDTQGFGLAIMEQPLPRANMEGMAALVQALDVPIEADESVVSTEDAFRVVAAHAADMLNIKLGKNGLGNCRTIAKFAQGMSIPIMIGTDFSLGVSVAAKLHLAAALPNVSAAAEFSELGLFEFDTDAMLLSRSRFEIEAHCLAVPQGPGLGVELDHEMIAEFPYRAA